jgi:AcrR family transcriptional regulator
LSGSLNAVNIVAAVQEFTRCWKPMGIAERREREREQVRTRIVEAARDLLSEDGLAALSMRAIAERIEYSPATIYLYFRDKDELIRDVVHAGFERMGEYVEAEIERLGARSVVALARYEAMGRAYARFALENTAYFRVMFELPAAAHVECPEPDQVVSNPAGLESVVETLRAATAEGSLELTNADQAAVIGWGLIHGLTSLYLSGHLAEQLSSHEEFFSLIEAAMSSMYEGWKPSLRAVMPGGAGSGSGADRP